MRWLSKVVLQIGETLKPILIKVFSLHFLRKIKRKIVNQSYNQMKNLGKIPLKKGIFPDGINLIGNIRAEIGLGQSCRLLARELEETKYPFLIYNYIQVSALKMNDHSWDKKIEDKVKYSINIMHINPYELGLALLQLDHSIWKDRYNIAFWLWELEEFPDEWAKWEKYLDEIWTPSEFASASIRKKVNIPVYTIPYYVTVPTYESCSRQDFNIPDDKFLFLIMFDSNSTISRKNPLGAIEAYKQAFSENQNDVGLVIKINNAQHKDIALLEKALEKYQNVYYITETLSKERVNSLIECTDVFVSLHRAEGFGLVMAEAMLLGTPVIATNWSSNVEFMNDQVACMVDYQKVTIDDVLAEGPYQSGTWAEPNILTAAYYMKKLYQDKEFYDNKKECALEYIKGKLSLESIVKKIENRIDDIYVTMDQVE